MSSDFQSFSDRASTLFGPLKRNGSASEFVLSFESGQNRVRNELVAETEPGPPLMSWQEVLNGSKDAETDVLEPSVAARQAFEAELEYDEFDSQAVQTMDSEFAKRERSEISQEVVEAEASPGGDNGLCMEGERREALLNLRQPRRYTCYALDKPILVGGGIPWDWNDDEDLGLEKWEAAAEAEKTSDRVAVGFKPDQHSKVAFVSRRNATSVHVGTVQASSSDKAKASKRDARKSVGCLFDIDDEDEETDGQAFLEDAALSVNKNTSRKRTYRTKSSK